MDLTDEAREVAAMERRLSWQPTRRVSATDSAALGSLLRRAEAGEPVYLIPPGLEEGELLVHEGPLSPMGEGA
jgi:hypothetical protein